MFNTILGPSAVGAGAALRYGSGSDQMMRLLVAPQHLLQHMLTFFEDDEFFETLILATKNSALELQKRLKTGINQLLWKS
jgi:hypothetical protein